MDRQYLPTKQEQTGNTLDFIPFDMSQTLADHCNIAALLNKYQTYTKPYMLL